MAASLPNFNLLCRIWHQTNVALQPDADNIPCQLYMPEPSLWSVQQGTTNLWQMLMIGRFPKGTAIWGARGGNYSNVVEIPRQTGRYYYVNFVDSCHRGFPNEYLAALLIQGTGWPTPAP